MILFRRSIVLLGRITFSPLKINDSYGKNVSYLKPISISFLKNNTVLMR